MRKRLILLPLLLLGFSPLLGQDFHTGLIPLKTTHAEISVTVPANQFGSGSDPLVVFRMPFQGRPLSTDPPGVLEPGDTVLELLESGLGYSGAYTDKLRFRIVGLRLQSTQPVTVTYGGANPELWDVEICMPNAAPRSFPQPEGVIDLRRNFPPGQFSGVFNYVLPVPPRLIFKRRGDSRRRSFDPSLMGFTAVGEWCDISRLFNPSPGTFRPGGFLDFDAGTVIDANCNGSFDSDEVNATLPGNSNLALGVTCGPNIGLPPTFFFLSPFAQWASGQTQFVEPATRASNSFPATKVDRLSSANPEPVSTQRSLAGLALLTGLGIGAVLIPTRRSNTDGTDQKE